MNKVKLLDKNIQRTKIEYCWNDEEMNLYTIYNILESLNYFCIPCFSDVEEDIKTLKDKILSLLGLESEPGDIIKTQYIVTYEDY